MRAMLKLLVIIVIGVLVVSLGCIGFSLLSDSDSDDSSDDGDNDVEVDTDPPVFDFVTGDTTGTAGKITTISVEFDDNVGVTEAWLYYQSEDDDSWSVLSVVNGTGDLLIPSDSADNWYYYVTIDDAAGNGPVGMPSDDGSSFYVINVSWDTQNLQHTVFIEEGTGTWCDNCPPVSEILHELYESGEYDFYYVSMVEDKNSLAEQRLEEDYNIWGYPSVYIDGGFEVVVGGSEPKSTYVGLIEKALQRDVPAIYVNVTVAYNESRDEIATAVLVRNYEEQQFTGRLRVYLTERVSWPDYLGDPYHFGYIDDVTIEDITVSDDDQIVVETIYEAGGRDVDNLMVIAVVFNDESVRRYSNPAQNEHPFDAYFADAVDGALIVEGGNLPPAVGITSPKNGRLHVFGRDVFATRQLKTILLGRTLISAQASDDSQVVKVAFYVDDELVAEFTEAPYDWRLTGPLFGPHTLEVVAYDDAGKVSSASLEVSTVIFLP